MTQPKTTDMTVYSPYPRSSYRWVVGGHSYGPATSSLLDTQETWNLAYLSHDYDSKRDHPDPHFSTHVRRTTQWCMDGSGPDLTGIGNRSTVGHLLNLPAPRFVYLIRQHPVLPSLPMFKAYGPTWVENIERRSRLCRADNYDPPLVLDMQEAARLLDAVMRK